MSIRLPLSSLPGASALSGLARVAVEVVYPALCPSCGTDTHSMDGVCPACWRDLALIDAPACRSCGRPVPPGAAEDLVCDDCLRHPPAWRQGVAAALYQGTARRMVLALKHGDRLSNAEPMARWMARRGSEVLADADTLVPVPLHWLRRLKRRGNQSAELARALSRLSGVRHAPGLLRRSRQTPSQAGRNREGRAANVAGAFAAHPEVRGQNVVLVDDVMTTGATLSEAAQACLGAGAARVDAIVFALAPGRERAYLRPEEMEDET